MKSASTATRLWAGRLGKWGWIPNKNRNISLLRSVQSGLGVQSPSYSKDIEGVFLKGELGEIFCLCERCLAGSPLFGWKVHLSIEKEVMGHHFITKCVRRSSVTQNS